VGGLSCIRHYCRWPLAHSAGSADQLPVTMRYFSAALGRECSGCHQTSRATGIVDFVADSDGKSTARRMIKMVEAVNGGDYGFKINCGTCHQGHGEPLGLQPATLMTFDQILQTNTQQANMALRTMTPGGPSAPAIRVVRVVDSPSLAHPSTKYSRNTRMHLVLPRHLSNRA
jgi:hypothetical protein